MSVVAHAVPRVDEVVVDEVVTGLQRTPKQLSGRTLLDDERALLRDQIAGVDDHYPARCELRLLDAHLAAIAAEVGVAARVIELGAGSTIATRRLLRALDRPASYIAADLVAGPLAYTASLLRAEHPQLALDALVGDFTRALKLPAPRRPHGRTLVYVPLATLGALAPHDAITLLAGVQRIVGTNARLLVGTDGTRDEAVLVHAYDDLDGVTAAYNRELLGVLRRARGVESLEPSTFSHRALWDVAHGRVELQLVSTIAQDVRVGRERVGLAAGEPIVTEHVYKHSLHAMRSMLLAAGWSPTEVFTAHEQPVRLWLCEARGPVVML